MQDARRTFFKNKLAIFCVIILGCD
ncbi:hypothetical protein PD280_08940 [Virgibacillus salarius]|nr:hypothetical protein [Virgibacillus salarius]WBX82219.1 hypothetical protein PD280_08940 [Virgibacillus salarius]